MGPGKFTYFDLNGRGEPHRSLMSHAGFAYEDNRIQQADWPAFKPETPLGGMPLWEEDGFTMCQNNAILRMLGVRLGYYPDNHLTAYHCDSIVDFCEDLIGPNTKFLFTGLGSGQCDVAAAPAFLEAVWDRLVSIVGARLDGHGCKYIAGTDRPMICDFKAFSFVSIANKDMNPACIIPQEVCDQIQAKIDACPAFKRWADCMKAELANHLANKPARPA